MNNRIMFGPVTGINNPNLGKTAFSPHANIKGPEQPAHLRRLVWAFDVCYANYSRFKYRCVIPEIALIRLHRRPS